jgi:hypothetical protein
LRRLLYTLIAGALVAALIPATALGRSHHRRHHARSHHARVHHRIRHRQFGHASDPATPSMSDNAGTVQSFDGTKLTILLADGTTTETGIVNNDTEIECEAADMSGTSVQGDDDQGGDNSGPGDQGDDNDQGDDDNNEAQNCDTSALTPGAIVHEAELRLSGAGAVWDKVELLTSSSSSSSSGDDD